MREWCAEAKQGRRCIDDLCRSGNALCGFSEEEYRDVCPQELKDDEELLSVDEEIDEAGQ